jgi:hypothetical protein
LSIFLVAPIIAAERGLKKESNVLVSSITVTEVNKEKEAFILYPFKKGYT